MKEAFTRKHADTIRSIRRKYIELKKEEIEEQILTIVPVYSLWGGVFPNQIAKILDIDKSNIVPYTKSLEKKGKINRKSPQSPYFPTDESFKNFSLEADLFGEISLRLLKKIKKKLILVNEEAQIPSKFDTYKNYYEPKFGREDYLERVLFEFSNRIGAFITRAVIEATRASNYNAKLLLKSTDIQNSMTQAYMKKAMYSLIPFLAPIFKKMIESTTEFRSEFYEQTGRDKYSWKCPHCGLYEEDSDIDKLTQFVTLHENKTGHKYEVQDIFDNRRFSLKKDERGNFLFTDKITLRLLNSFCNIYPFLGYEFNRIIENMPNSKESYKKFTELLYKKWESQRKCNHSFGNPVESLHGFVNVCSKCGFTKAVKDRKTKLTMSKRKLR